MAAALARRARTRHHALRNAASIPAQADRPACRSFFYLKETRMQWTTPTATDLRFGFEITMYVSAR